MCKNLKSMGLLLLIMVFVLSLTAERNEPFLDLLFEKGLITYEEA